MTEALKSELVGQIAEKHAVVVVGTGVSLAATNGDALASWKGLIDDGIKRCVDLGLRKSDWADTQNSLLGGDLKDVLGVAEQVSSRLGWKATDPCDGDWSEWLRTTVGALRAEHPELIQAIRDLDAPIATLNYDNLLTEVTDRRPITWKNAERWLPVLQGIDEAILHLHGHWDQPSSVVLGIRSYDEAMGKELAQHLQRVLASLHSLVFIGCSGTVQDPNFSTLIAWMRDQLRGAEHSHYLLLSEGEPPPIEESLLRQARIVTLRYGTARADLPLFIRSLVSDGSTSATELRAKLSDSHSLPSETISSKVHSVQCPKCGLSDIERVESVSVESFDAVSEGWAIGGSVSLHYCAHNRCCNCGSVFDDIAHAIPVQYESLTCTECGEAEFLKCKVSQVKKLHQRFTFLAIFSCKQCHLVDTVKEELRSLSSISAIKVSNRGVSLTTFGEQGI